jgi:hypothetical protein
VHSIINTFTIPWYIWVGIGVFLTLMIVSPNFRHESDAFLARLLGMRPKQQRNRQVEDEDEE